MKLKIVKNKLIVTKEAEDPAVCSVGALLHKIMFELKVIGIPCKVAHLDKCSCVTGSIEKQKWILCEDIDTKTKQTYNTSNAVPFIFDAKQKVIDTIRNQIKKWSVSK